MLFKVLLLFTVFYCQHYSEIEMTEIHCRADLSYFKWKKITFNLTFFNHLLKTLFLFSLPVYSDWSAGQVCCDKLTFYNPIQYKIQINGWIFFGPGTQLTVVYLIKLPVKDNLVNFCLNKYKLMENNTRVTKIKPHNL